MHQTQQELLKKQNGQIVNCTIKVNKTNMATGFYDYLLYDIIPRTRSVRAIGIEEDNTQNTQCSGY